MSIVLKRLALVTVGSVALAVASGSVIAQQANPNSGRPDFTSAPPATPGESRVSEPEPTPNPVKDSETSRGPEAAGGIDPELGPIAEPDSGDIAPALRVQGEGDWVSPEEELRARIRREALERAAAAAKVAGNGLVMPKLVGPTIPFVPLELLFPPEVQAVGPQVVRESRGNAIVIGALDRASGKNVRLRIPVGGQAVYGALRMKVSGCYAAHPEDRFEAWAYVDVSNIGGQNLNQLAVLPQRDRRRVKEASSERSIRKGWIIASSPAVTPIDDAVYDMWLIGCEGGAVAPPVVPQSAPSTTRRNSNAKAAAAGPPGSSTPAAPLPVEGSAVPETAAPTPAPAEPQTKETTEKATRN